MYSTEQYSTELLFMYQLLYTEQNMYSTEQYSTEQYSTEQYSSKQNNM